MTKIIHKKSSVASKVPLVTDLDYGELALNYQDGKLFYKAADNTIKSISSGGGTADRLTNFTSYPTTDVTTDNVDSCVGYIGGLNLLGQSEGALYSHVYSSAWKHNIYGDYRTGQIAVRAKNNGAWGAWRIVLDSSNYTSYSPSLTGTGASGTWGISINGNAANVTGTVAIVNGGTGATSAANALTNLGAAPTASPTFSGNITVGSTSSKLGINTTPSVELHVKTFGRVSGQNSVMILTQDSVTGSQTAGFGNRIQWQTNGNSTNAAIGFEVGGDGTNNQSQLSFYTQNAAGGLTRRVLVDSLGNLVLSKSLQEARVAMAANDIDISSGNYFTKTFTSGTTTLTASNVPASGTTASFILDATNAGLATIVFGSGFTSVKWVGGTQPTLTSSGRDVLGFFTHDAGATWTGLLLGKDVK